VRVKEEWGMVRVRAATRDRVNALAAELDQEWKAADPRAVTATQDDAIGEALDAYALWNGKEATR
jgi:hypothetical protein